MKKTIYHITLLTKCGRTYKVFAAERILKSIGGTESLTTTGQLFMTMISALGEEPLLRHIERTLKETDILDDFASITITNTGKEIEVEQEFGGWDEEETSTLRSPLFATPWTFTP